MSKLCKYCKNKLSWWSDSIIENICNPCYKVRLQVEEERELKELKEENYIINKEKKHERN